MSASTRESMKVGWIGAGRMGFEMAKRLAGAGCDGALVATALHDGRLGSGDIAGARRLGHARLTR